MLCRQMMKMVSVCNLYAYSLSNSYGYVEKTYSLLP